MPIVTPGGCAISVDPPTTIEGLGAGRMLRLAMLEGDPRHTDVFLSSQNQADLGRHLAPGTPRQYDEAIKVAGDIKRRLIERITPADFNAIQNVFDARKISYAYKSSDEAHLEATVQWIDAAHEHFAWLSNEYLAAFVEPETENSEMASPPVDEPVDKYRFHFIRARARRERNIPWADGVEIVVIAGTQAEAVDKVIALSPDKSTLPVDDYWALQVKHIEAVE